MDESLVCAIVLNRSHSKDISLGMRPAISLGMRPAITLMFSTVVCQPVQLALAHPPFSLLLYCIVALLHLFWSDCYYTHSPSSAVVWGNSECRAGEVGIAHCSLLRTLD